MLLEGEVFYFKKKAPWKNQAIKPDYLNYKKKRFTMKISPGKMSDPNRSFEKQKNRSRTI